MPTLIPAPTIIHAAGDKPARIEEHAGWVGGAEYIAIHPPALSPDTGHRDPAS